MHAPLFSHPDRVTFADTDASGWMHFSKVFRFVEEAEHEFLRWRGLLVFDKSIGGWPRVNVACDYLRPLAFGDEVETRLSILRLGNSSVTWGFEIVTSATNETAARGSMTTVFLNADGKPAPIPEDWRARLA